ncbi:MAG: hypothetical protein KatS3mg102_2523 [Planctomycetota bacterium]|nr:MAG: hypothetical protein KatS3mg102_2523 [Planctomycetota bacterium]
MQRFVRAVRSSALAPGSALRVVLDGHEVALFRTADGGTYAIEDRCPHQYAPLSEGQLTGTVVRCRLHGWSLDVRTGRPPVGQWPCVRAYPVRIEQDWVLVGLGPAPDAGGG